MKRVFRRLPKKVLASLAVAGAIIGVSVAARAWWPERPTYTIAHPAPHVTFNSITDNPNFGDERTFFDAKNAANTQSGGFAGRVKVEDGETLLLRTYVHNNAADNLNDAAHGYRGVARDTKVKIYLPTATADALRANSYVSASNATPREVADSVDFYGDLPFSLEYVRGSAITYNNAHTQGIALNDSIVTTGAPLGYQNMDGTIPGCFQYANIVTIKVKVKMQKPRMEVSKQVAIPGQPWTENVNVDPGATVSYLITVKNTGNTQLDHVSIRDKLPKDVRIVPGSTMIYNSNYPGGIAAGSDAVVSNGIDIGSYGVNGGAYVKFKATLPNADKLECGTNKQTNTGEAFIPGKPDVVRDTADVTIKKKCENPVVIRCESLTAPKYELLTGEQTVFTAKGYVENATITGYTFRVNGKVVQDGTKNTYAFKQDKEGSYVVLATVKTDKGNASSHGCEKTVKVKKQVTPVYRCEGLNITTIKNRDVSIDLMYVASGGARLKSVSYDFGDGKSLLTDKTSNVLHTYEKDGTYIVRPKLTFTVNGRDVVVESDKCVKTVTFSGSVLPTTTTLPNTGAGDIAGIFGAVTVAGALSHKLFMGRRSTR
jgi:uncharacterized repeat protein (TIGR01451 family)